MLNRISPTFSDAVAQKIKKKTNGSSLLIVFKYIEIVTHG